MLGQIFLFGCVLALASIAAIIFVVFGPVPVKRRVEVVPLSASRPVFAAAMPSLAAQLAPAREQTFTPAFASAAPAFQSTIQGAAPPVTASRSSSHVPSPPPLPIAVTPPPTRSKGQKVQPRQKQRVARGTGQPFAPVVRSAQRQYREEDAVTNQVRLFEAEDLTIDESR